jgi:hypothetical protein
MGLVETVLGMLAVWRVTHFLHAEDGPWQSILRLRRAAGAGFWADLLNCFYCLSLWVSLPVALVMGRSVREYFLLWLGLSGGAILIQRATTPGAPFLEDTTQEKRDAVLWRDEAAGGRPDDSVQR